MVAARRAALPDESPVAELGPVSPARRGSGGRAAGRGVRLFLAPLAIVSVAGLAAGLMFVPADDDGVQHTDPGMAAAVPLGVSRNMERAELSPSPTPTPTPTPSQSVAATPPAAQPAAQAPSATPTVTPSATATASASASPTVKAAPAPDYDALGKELGTRYATSAVNVRTGPGKDFESITTIDEADAVEATDREIDGWRQVVVKDEAGWIKSTFLSKDKPEVEEPSDSSTGSSGDSSSSGSSDTGYSSASCPKAGNLEANLTSRTAAVLRALCAKFDGVSSYGGYRPGAGSYHGSGQAIDVMVSGEYGWEIARWARANASSLGVIEVIYEQKIWTSQRGGEGWRGMSDRGGATANHYDHVHISVR